MRATVLIALALTAAVLGLFAMRGARNAPLTGPPPGTPSDWTFYVEMTASPYSPSSTPSNTP